MTVVLIEQDPFVDNVASIETNTALTSQNNVRRPIYGHMHKENTFAYLQVKAIDSKGAIRDVLVPNSSAPGGKGTKNYNFILQSFSYSQQEKVQIIETFGDEYVFFYGKKPTVVMVQGFLINTPDFNWRGEWYSNYENYLRGTKCVERKARVYLSLDGLVFVGYILNTTTQVQDQQPRLTPFSFNLLVTNFKDTNIPVVTKAEEARILNKPSSTSLPGNPLGTGMLDSGMGTGSEPTYGDLAVEYMGLTKTEKGVEWDPVKRDWKDSSLSGAKAPATFESMKTAWWLGGIGADVKHTYSSEEALREVGVRNYIDRNPTSSRFDAVSAYNSGNTLFSTEEGMNDDVKKALGGGLQGGAARV